MKTKTRIIIRIAKPVAAAGPIGIDVLNELTIPGPATRRATNSRPKKTKPTTAKKRAHELPVKRLLWVEVSTEKENNCSFCSIFVWFNILRVFFN